MIVYKRMKRGKNRHNAPGKHSIVPLNLSSVPNEVKNLEFVVVVVPEAKRGSAFHF